MGGVCFLKPKKEEKARGARIDSFDGDGLVGGVCFLENKKEEKARGALILFPAGSVGAY